MWILTLTFTIILGYFNIWYLGGPSMPRNPQPQKTRRGRSW